VLVERHAGELRRIRRGAGHHLRRPDRALGAGQELAVRADPMLIALDRRPLRIEPCTSDPTGTGERSAIGALDASRSRPRAVSARTAPSMIACSASARLALCAPSPCGPGHERRGLAQLLLALEAVRGRFLVGRHPLADRRAREPGELAVVHVAEDVEQRRVAPPTFIRSAQRRWTLSGMALNSNGGTCAAPRWIAPPNAPPNRRGETDVLGRFANGQMLAELAQIVRAVGS
jgi:hypothetical protein